MSIPNFGYLEGLTSLEEVQGALAQLKRTLDFYFQGKMSTSNIRELAGWQATENLLMSLDEDVGFSTIDTAADDLRIWAGSTVRESAPFRVYESGSMFATKGAIGGWQLTDNRLQDAAGLVGFSSELTGANDVRIWAGNTNINEAPFRVYESGEIYSIAGHIGGWMIGQESLSDELGYAGMSAARNLPTNVRFWAGDDNPDTAPFVVYDNGELYTSSMTAVGGSITGSLIRTAEFGQRIEMFGSEMNVYSPDGTRGINLTTSFSSWGVPAMVFYDPSGAEVGYLASLSALGLEFSGPGNTLMSLMSGVMRLSASQIELWGGGTGAFNVYVRDGSSMYKVLSERTDFYTDSGGYHNHGIPDGTELATVGGGSVTFVASGNHSHNVYFTN